MSNRLCQLLGIEHPIVQAPMAYICAAELVAAVSNAGALGTIGPNPGPAFWEGDTYSGDPKEKGELLRAEIRRTRQLTDRPFAVNFLIGRGGQIPFSDRFVEVGIEEQVPVGIVTMGSPDVYCRRLKDAGMVVLQAIGSVAHAKKAADCGVDGVIAEGFEGGGHLGTAELPISVLAPQIADAVDLPLIIGGGIVDARGFVAALALGADAVYIGTRFMATKECPVHPNAKQAVIDAIDTSTVAFARKTGFSRVLRNRFADEHIKLEAGGATFAELRDYERSGHAELHGRRRVPAAMIDGDVELGSLGMGAGAGAIHEILSAAEVVQSLCEGSSAVLKGVGAKLR